MELNDHELLAWLKGLDASVAEGRQRQNEPLATWFSAVRDAAEAEQRRRRGVDADEATIILSIVAAALALPEDRRQRLMASYEDLALGRSTVPPGHPASKLVGILASILWAAAAPPTVA